jgi:tetratricopeptide (TPR) repeat protein
MRFFSIVFILLLSNNIAYTKNYIDDELVFKFILAEISKQRGFYNKYINLYSDIIISTKNKSEAIKILKNNNAFFQKNSKLKLFQFLGEEKLNSEEVINMIKFVMSEKESEDFIILYETLSDYIRNHLSNYKIRNLLEKISTIKTTTNKNFDSYLSFQDDKNILDLVILVNQQKYYEAFSIIGGENNFDSDLRVFFEFFIRRKLHDPESIYSINYNPGSTFLKLVALDYYIENRDFKSAENILEMTNKSDFKDRKKLADLFFSLEMYENALEIYHSLAVTQELIYRMAFINKELNNKDESLRLFKLIDDRYYYYDALLNIILIKYDDDKQKALSFLKDAIINENLSQENLIFQLMKAKYLKNIDQKYEAYQILNEIKEYLDDNGLYELAILADALELHDIFDQTMKGLIARHRNNADFLNTFAYSLMLRGQRLDYSESLINKAISILPDAPHIIDSLGYLEYLRGNFEKSKNLFEKALSKDSHPEIAHHLISVLIKLGQKKEAIEIFESFRKKHADYFEKPEVKESIIF